MLFTGIAKGKQNISCCCRTVVVIRCTSEFVEEAPTELRIRGKSDQNSPYNFNTLFTQTGEENKEDNHYCMLTRCITIIKII